MRLKLLANSFLVVGERERGNVCVNSKCTSFAGACKVEVPKMFDACETLMLALSLSVHESNFERSFFSSSVCHLYVRALIRLFRRDIFSPRFNVASDIVFLIFKLN